MEEKIKLAENVILVDVTYFNRVISELKQYFEAKLGRRLQDMHIEEWASCLALDAGIRNKDNKIEVLFVHDAQTGKLLHCDPADLTKDLNGTGYTNQLGELTFTSVSSEGFVSPPDLYLDLLSIILNSADVKNLLLVSSGKDYDAKLQETLHEATVDKAPESMKQVFLFSMDARDSSPSYKWDLLGYSLIRGLGIKSEELQ